MSVRVTAETTLGELVGVVQAERCMLSLQWRDGYWTARLRAAEDALDDDPAWGEASHDTDPAVAIDVGMYILHAHVDGLPTARRDRLADLVLRARLAVRRGVIRICLSCGQTESSYGARQCDGCRAAGTRRMMSRTEERMAAALGDGR